MKKKYQVFISSTYTDLKEERMAVTQCLLDNDCIPVGMEQFPASGMAQIDYIKRILDDCDYYILILAGRYGSLDADRVGFTEKEFDYASAKGIPIMSFVIDDPKKLSFEKHEKTEDGQRRLLAFRDKVCAGRMVKFYTDAGDLKAQIATAINRCIKDFPAAGWIRGEDVLRENNREDSEKKAKQTDRVGRGARRQNTRYQSEPRQFDGSVKMRELKNLNDGIGLDDCKFIDFCFDGDPDSTIVKSGNELIQAVLTRIYKMKPEDFEKLRKDPKEQGLVSFFYGTGDPRTIKSRGHIQTGKENGIEIELKSGAGRKIELINQIMHELHMDPAMVKYRAQLKEYIK